MLKRIGFVIMICLFVLAWAGCAAHIHKVGKGAMGNQYIEQRQWYVLWGLVPINEVDTVDMAAGANDYTITTELSALDVLINLFTAEISIVSRTVTVEK